MVIKLEPRNKRDTTSMPLNSPGKVGEELDFGAGKLKYVVHMEVGLNSCSKIGEICDGTRVVV